VLSASGPDAGKFLQGQLSNDTLKLPIGAAQLTALHTVQGRVQAIINLLRADESQYLAVLPRELLADVMSTLQKRVFRAKLTLSDASARWQVCGAGAAPANSLHAVVDGSGRCLVLRDLAENPAISASASREDWRALDIAAGLPQVYASSQNEFTAQMLNLDLLAAIAFDKGCYVGQEIVARTHYRGRAKRRLQRFAHAAAAASLPGAAIVLACGAAALVVDSTRGAGYQELLAVTSFDAAGALPVPYQLPPAESAPS
jgi:tRNA-modifying protein YgfZ